MRKKVSLTLVSLVLAGFLGFLGYRFLPQIIADEAYPLEYLGEITECADAFGLDRPLLAALILKESGFNSRAVSHAGAMGLAQVMPATFRANYSRLIGRELQGMNLVNDPFNPRTSICVGAGVLAGNMGSYGGDWTAALIAYNGGDGAARRYLAAKSSAGLVAETRLYAPKILAARDVYATMYADKFAGGIRSAPPSSGEAGGGSNAQVIVKTPTPINLRIPKPSEQANAFWKGFARDVFARFFSK